MRIGERTTLHASRRLPLNDIAIYTVKRNEDGLFIAEPPTFTAHVPGAEGSPTLSLDMEAAQELFEELWAIGLRPALGRSTEGLDDARKEHIEDLRRALFAKPTYSGASLT